MGQGAASAVAARVDRPLRGGGDQSLLAGAAGAHPKHPDERGALRGEAAPPTLEHDFRKYKVPNHVASQRHESEWLSLAT